MTMFIAGLLSDGLSLTLPSSGQQGKVQQRRQKHNKKEKKIISLMALKQINNCEVRKGVYLSKAYLQSLIELIELID